jgi:hypothetical protein
MLRWILLCTTVPFIGLAALNAQTPAPVPSAASLPVRRVVLYKTGVGYFEHVGEVRGAEDVAIHFTTAQLNDVLKSLTTIDLGDGRITGISYNSVAPLGERLRTIRLPVGARATRAEVLGALRGARVSVRSAAGIVTGRLVSVETRTRGEGEHASTVEEIVIVTDGAELRTYELTPSVAIRIDERDLHQELARYLTLVGSERDQDVRRMLISTQGTGARQIFVSYVSEVPIWKTSYRLVLPSQTDRKPLLQGWAIVDNTVGEDWNLVQLSLVAGSPQSFIQQISQPYYAQRPVVPLPGHVQLAPQTHQPTLSTSGEASGVVIAEQGTRDSIMRRDSRGFAGGVLPPPPPPASPAATPELYRPDVEKKMAAFEPVAQAAELGDLFEYRITDPVTIRKNESALVPIVRADVTAEKVSLWSQAASSGRPLRAVWLTNSSGQTLDGGSFSVIESDAFAGEGLIAPVKPGERRLISYAVDLGVLVESKADAARTRISQVRIAHGILVQQVEQRQTRVYTLRNEDVTPRTVVIEHPARAGWKLAADATPAETAPGIDRFRVSVDPKKTVTLAINESKTEEVRNTVTDVTEEHVAIIVRQGAPSAGLEQALRPVWAKKTEIAALDQERAARQGEMAQIDRDQQRVRENMKALKGSADERTLVERYARQLNAQEDQMEALRKALADLDARSRTLHAELASLIESVSLD